MSSTIITGQFLSVISNLKFRSSADINNYFVAKTGNDFIPWFNANIALKENWGKIGSRSGVKMAEDVEAVKRFNQLWNQIPILFASPQINLLQFLALMSIINNETGGKIKPVTELVGNKANPGLAYAFNKISGLKRSYNTLASNKTAYDLFNDPNYKAQHGGLTLANNLKDTKNVEWKGEIYPKGIDSSLDINKTGFIQEADFFKFRGRGFIQTTTRGNYKRIINLIIAYKGTNSIVNQYKTKWMGKDPDVIATISTNSDWDTLFQNTELIIPSAAISAHSQSSGNYLSKIFLEPGVDVNIKQMGKSISGSNDYANLFLNRVLQIANSLGN